MSRVKKTPCRYLLCVLRNETRHLLRVLKSAAMTSPAVDFGRSRRRCPMQLADCSASNITPGFVSALIPRSTYSRSDVQKVVFSSHFCCSFFDRCGLVLVGVVAALIVLGYIPPQKHQIEDPRYVGIRAR